eukprot:CAMPEP_0170565676 /NCGR_PEP_ID=MMETSP0211-20121228/79342_1 /TAXON_ID=311385 /ORGANISM="Pseudokeronopsis sp., Strain OXSARD2" /LENGTH=638 /DNA_ID=CAMNT_0010886619 /DNA_START=192 /DNA_END=2109 /DNA_ORIENTATION=+
MVSSAEGLGFDPEIHLQVDEEVEVFLGLEGEEGHNGAHRAREEDDLLAPLGEAGLLDAGPHLPREELTHLLHLEGRPVQVPILPLELCGCWVILRIVLTAQRQTSHKHVLELVHTSHSVVIQQTKVSQPTIQHVISEDVELDGLRFELEDMDAFLDIPCKDPSLFHLHLDDGGLKVLILHFPQQLFYPHLIHSQDVPHAHYQPTLLLVEGRRDVLAGRLVAQHQTLPALHKLVAVDEAEGASSRLQFDINAHSEEKEGVARTPDGLADEMGEDHLIPILELYQLHSLEVVGVDDLDAAGELVDGCFGVAELAFFRLQVLLVPGRLKDPFSDLLPIPTGVAMVFFLEDDQVVRFGVYLDLHWSVQQRQHRLRELFAEPLHGDDPEGVASDGYDAFGALLGAEGGGFFEEFVAEGGDLHFLHVHVAQPRLVRHGHQGVSPLQPDLRLLHRRSPQEPRPAVRQHPRHVVHHRPQNHSIVQPHMQEQLLLGELLFAEVEEGDGFGAGGDGLHADALEAGLRVQTHDLDRPVQEAHCKESAPLPPLWHLPQVQTRHLGVVEARLVLVEVPVQLIQLKVHDLTPLKDIATCLMFEHAFRILPLPDSHLVRFLASPLLMWMMPSSVTWIMELSSMIAASSVRSFP